MESGNRELADGKCNQGVGTWKLTAGGLHMESNSKALAGGK